MLIVCPNCETSYDVAAASLGADGRSVRCVRCREVWFATPQAGMQAGTEREAAGMVSASAASAQYRRGAGAEAPISNGIGDDPSSQEPASEDAFAVDPNLAARAANRATAAFDDPAPGGDTWDTAAVGMDDGASLAEHDAPPLAPDESASAESHEPAEDIESFAARRVRRTTSRKGRGIRRGLLAVIMLLLATNAAVLGWRSDVVRLLPQTGSLFAAIGLPVNLRGLALTDVTTTREMHDGVSVLLVQGTIANVSRLPHDVPRLRFAMRNAAGSEVYSWTMLPGAPKLAPGEAQPFQTRLASPPTEARDVVVRFFLHRDAALGGH